MTRTLRGDCCKLWCWKRRITLMLIDYKIQVSYPGLSTQRKKSCGVHADVVWCYLSEVEVWDITVPRNCNWRLGKCSGESSGGEALSTWVQVQCVSLVRAGGWRKCLQYGHTTGHVKEFESSWEVEELRVWKCLDLGEEQGVMGNRSGT
jgi:hypothetical protein